MIRKSSVAAGLIFVLVFLLVVVYYASGIERRSLTDQVRASAPGQFAALSEGFVHYEFAKSGGGPVVVLVHGFSVPYYVWDPTMAALLDQGFRVLRYDLYGRGYSDRPEAAYDLDLYLDQLDELLVYLNLEGDIHLVGLSQGAPIAAAYVNQHPGQVNSLVLVDPLISRVKKKDIFPLNLPLVGEFIARVALVPHILPGSQADDFFRPENFPEWEARYRQQLQYKGFRRAILSSIRYLVDFEPLAEYRAVGLGEVPVLLFWGREDQTIPYGDVQRLQEVLPQVELHIIEEAGHLPHYERPEAVNPILVKFLRSQTSD